jgi:hypothetical protein
MIRNSRNSRRRLFANAADQSRRMYCGWQGERSNGAVAKKSVRDGLSSVEVGVAKQVLAAIMHDAESFRTSIWRRRALAIRPAGSV